MSVRQDIVTAMLAALAGITTANSYHSNAGRNCKELSDIPVDPNKMPAIRVQDGESTVNTENIPFGYHEHQLRVTVIGYTNSMSDVRLLGEDITAVCWTNKTWSGKARWTALERHVCEQVHADKKFCMAQLDFLITYRTALGAI